jgi:hypothetical protein
MTSPFAEPSASTLAMNAVHSESAGGLSSIQPPVAIETPATAEIASIDN